MNRIAVDIGDITAGLFVSFIGLTAIVISLFRLKSKDFTFLNFGLFCSIYGIRWLIDTPTIITLGGLPLHDPFLRGVLTYVLPIPFTAFLVEMFGHGVYNSLVWVFRSTIVYAVAALAYDLFLSSTPAGGSINPAVVVLWCSVWVVNFFILRKQKFELYVLRGVFVFLILCIANDNLVILRLLPWEVHLTHVGFVALCVGLGFTAARHFFSTEKQLFAIRKEFEIARRIQQFNLPGKLPSPDGFDIAARYIPMSAVAGDFYDIQFKGKNGAAILIADVSGHGVGAALIGSMLKIAFASQAKHIADPSRVLGEINRMLQGKTEDSFVTACCLFIDVQNGILRYANAGHPPPIVWRRFKKEISRLSNADVILGPFPNPVYVNTEINLAQNDRLVLYTDGIVEAKSKKGEFFGEERFKALIEASSGPAGSTADELVDHVFKWSGKSRETSLDDDLTLVIVDVLSGRDIPSRKRRTSR